MEENKEVKQKPEEEKNNHKNGSKPPGNLLGNKKPRFNAMWIYALIGVSIILIYLFDSNQGPVSIDWKFFQNELLLKNEIDKIQVVNEQYAEIYIKPDKLDEPKHQKNFSKGFNAFTKAGPHYTMTIGSNDLFMKKLDEAQANVPEADKIYPEFVRKRSFSDTFYILFPLIILVIIYLVIFRRMSGGGGACRRNKHF